MQDDPLVYDLGELGDRAGVTPRTIRYYIQQGLLRSPGMTGPGAKYGQGHLDRLRLIRRMQREHLPLAEIRRRLEAMSDAQVRELLAGREVVGEPGATYSGAAAERSQWERISLTPDLELHVRRPLSREHNKVVERLLTHARRLLEEDIP